jgi:hypothetical protein
VCKSNGKRKTAPGTLDDIINQVEMENNLPKGSINRETVLTRMKAKNPCGVSDDKVSPIAILDHTIVDFIVHLAKSNKPLTKHGIKLLVDEMIRDTPLEACYRKFCLE